jgi:hypothetical protein
MEFIPSHYSIAKYHNYSLTTFTEDTDLPHYAFLYCFPKKFTL